jgi:hypothetical protein
LPKTNVSVSVFFWETVRVLGLNILRKLIGFPSQTGLSNLSPLAYTNLQTIYLPNTWKMFSKNLIILGDLDSQVNSDFLSLIGFMNMVRTVFLTWGQPSGTILTVQLNRPKLALILNTNLRKNFLRKSNEGKRISTFIKVTIGFLTLVVTLPRPYPLPPLPPPPHPSPTPPLRFMFLIFSMYVYCISPSR